MRNYIWTTNLLHDNAHAEQSPSKFNFERTNGKTGQQIHIIQRKIETFKVQLKSPESQKIPTISENTKEMLDNQFLKILTIIIHDRKRALAFVKKVKGVPAKMQVE